MHQLHHGEAAALVRIEEDLAPFGERDELTDGDIATGGHVAQTGQAAIDEYPLAIVEMEIGHRLTVFVTDLFVGNDEIVRVPTIKRLMMIDHETIVLRNELAVRGGVVEIEHRQLTGVGLTAEWAFGLRGVVEDVPTLFAVAGLQEIARLDESIFPFCCAGAPGRCVEPLNKGPIE